MVPRWQATVEKKLTVLRDLLRAGVEEGWLPGEPKPMIDFIQVVKTDGSLGVHNIFSINDLLDRSIATLEKQEIMEKK
jgi:hypothetical protein